MEQFICDKDYLVQHELLDTDGSVNRKVLDRKAQIESYTYFDKLLHDSDSLERMQNTVSMIHTIWKTSNVFGFTKVVAEYNKLRRISCDLYFTEIGVVENVCKLYIDYFMDWLMYYWSCFAEQLLTEPRYNPWRR